MNGTLTLSMADWAVLIAAISAVIIVGIRATRRNQTTSRSDDTVDYILAGRKLTTPLFAASLIATWYGSVLGAGEFIAKHGAVMILCFGVPYYVVAIAYALFLTKAIRMSNAVSIADQIRSSFGERAGVVAAVMMLVFSIPAPFMLSIGLVIQSVMGLPLWVGVISGSTVALFIVAKGGLQSDVHANVVQVTLMYAGFAGLAFWSLNVYGPPTAMLHILPSKALQVPGSLGWSGIAVWFLIALQTFIDPNFHVRAAAAKTSDVARRGLLWSVAGWIIFDSLQLFIGLYAVAYAPATDPNAVLLHSAETVLPPLWKGLFISGVLAAIMSTLDGYALSSSTIIGHDLIDRWKGGGHRRSSLRLGLLFTGIIGSVAAILLPSVVDLIFYAASIAVPALFLPLIMSLRTRHRHDLRKNGELTVLVWMVVPALIALIATILRAASVVDIEPMLLGLIASVLFLPRILRAHGTQSHQ